MNEDRYFLTLKSMPLKDLDGNIVGNSIQPSVVPFDESLEALQKQVGGYIEHFVIDAHLDRLGIDMWIDEEGKFKENLKPTFVLLDDTYHLIDIIFGNCVFTRYDQQGNTLGLTLDDINEIGKWLGSLRFEPINKDPDQVLDYAFLVPGFGLPF